MVVSFVVLDFACGPSGCELWLCVVCCGCVLCAVDVSLWLCCSCACDCVIVTVVVGCCGCVFVIVCLWMCLWLCLWTYLWLCVG